MAKCRHPGAGRFDPGSLEVGKNGSQVPFMPSFSGKLRCAPQAARPSQAVRTRRHRE